VILLFFSAYLVTREIDVSELWPFLLVAGLIFCLVSGRALTGSSYSSNTAMTIEACAAYCTENNYALAGLEYSSQCYW
jgi:hypothetical protein